MYARCHAEWCVARGEWTRAQVGTRCTLSVSMACRRHGQSKGYDGTYSWSGRLAAIGWRRRWPVGVDGEAAMAGLPLKPWSPWSVLARERGKVRCRGCGGWQVGSWGSSWAAAHRRLGVCGGGGESERGQGNLCKDCLRLLPFFLSKHKRTKRIRGRERRVTG
jgi:hypothetical protein